MSNSKYLDFQQVEYKGKTKRFFVVSKTSFDECKNCSGAGYLRGSCDFLGNYNDCIVCKGSGKIPFVLGKIEWYGAWRQYIFSPSFPTIWSIGCLKDIENFLFELMEERRIVKILDKPIEQPRYVVHNPKTIAKMKSIKR